MSRTDITYCTKSLASFRPKSRIISREEAWEIVVGYPRDVHGDPLIERHSRVVEVWDWPERRWVLKPPPKPPTPQDF